MHRRVCVALLCLSGCATSGAGPSAQTAGPVPQAEVAVAAAVTASQKLFVGPEALAVSQVKLEDGTYLMRITGSDSSVDGKVLPYQRQDHGHGRQVFITLIDGRKFWVLHRTQNSGTVDYKLYAPHDGSRYDISLRFDGEGSKTVDAQALVRDYRRILADGSLAELQRFKRDAEQAKARKRLDEALAELNQACDSQIELRVDWKGIDDETLKKLSVSGYCAPPLTELRDLCKSPGVKQLVKLQLKLVQCAFGSERSIQLAGPVLSWVTFEGSSNADAYAREYLLAAAPWSSAKNPAEIRYVESSQICHDGKSIYVGLHPRRGPKQASGDHGAQIFFGDGRDFKRVPYERYASDDWFYDPRFFVASHSANVRGTDYRYHSRFVVNEKEGTCRVTCGKRTLDLGLLSRQQTAKLMAAASFAEPRGQRVPYGLARDRRGTYFFVDRGPEKDSRDFRLFKGPTGRLRPLKMTNVVADSEGDVFSTQSGSLRLVLEHPHSFWIRGKRRSKLINVPIRDNLQLIYNELGIYLGQPFNTPCDLL